MSGIPDSLPVLVPISIQQGGSCTQIFNFVDADDESSLRTGDTFALRISNCLTGELLATWTGANGKLDVDVPAGTVTVSNLPVDADDLPTDAPCVYDLWWTRENGISKAYFAGPAEIYKRVPTT